MNGRRILLVGDRPDAIELLTCLFRALEWEVAPALSVAEALDRRYPPPDCLLANVVLSLPDGSLYDIIRAAHERSPGLRVVLLNDPRDFYDEEVLRRVKEQGFGLPEDGSASDEQYHAFLGACDRTRDHLLDELREEIGNLVVGWYWSAGEVVRACTPA